MAMNPLLRPYQLYRYWYNTEPLYIKMIAYIPWALATTIAFLRFWLTLYDFKYNEALYLREINNYLTKGVPVSPISKTNDNINLHTIDTNPPITPPTPMTPPTPIETMAPTYVIPNTYNSWWIKYRLYFGTLKGSIITVFIVFILYSIIITYLRTVSKILCLSFHFLYFGIAILICVIAHKNISKYRNEFYIGEELRIATKPAILFMILFGSSIIIEQINLFGSPLTNIVSTILTFISTSMGVSVFTIITLWWGIECYYVFKANNLMLNSETIHIDINQCIQNKDGYYLFFEHLIGELGVENLEFITDAIYVKNKFNTKPNGSFEPTTCVNVNRNDADHENFVWPTLPNDIHKSLIMECKTFYDAMIMINELYIKENSLKEINVSYTLRMALISKISDNKSIDINIFDDCIEEILYLLKQSYLRFQLSKKYQIFAKALKAL